MNALPLNLGAIEGGVRRIACLRCAADPRLEYYAWVPRHMEPGAEPLVLVHGISRNAAELIARFVPDARLHGRPLIAPIFGEREFARYQLLGRSPLGMTADAALIAMLEDAASRFGTATAAALFGFSGGAQFVHRFALAHPRRTSACVPVSAGWFCWPDPDLRWPLGWKGGPVSPDREAIAAVPFHVLVGARDTVRDEALRRDPVIDALQGETRRTRARAWHKAMRRAGLNARGSHAVLPRTRHSFSSAVRAGLVAAVFERLGQEGNEP